jgi:hypothetical protein
MSSLILRLSLCAAVMACVAGCGGSSSGNNTGGGGGGGGGGSTPTTVTYTFNGAAPAVVATQIGTGTYAQASLASDKLTLTIPAGTTNYAVAFLCPTYTDENNVSSNLERVIQASTLDGTSFSEGCAATPTYGNATVQVDATAIPGAEFIEFGELLLPLSTADSGTTVGLPVGTSDVPVLAVNNDIVPVAAKILRNQTVPGALNGGNAVDFAVSDEMVPETVTYNGIPAGFGAGTLNASYETANGGSIPLSFLLFEGPTPYYAMPAAAYQTGDYYNFNAFSFSTNNSGEAVGVEEYTSNGGPPTLTFPTPWAQSGPTAAALPAFNYDYSGFSGKADVLFGAELYWKQGTVFDTLTISASQNYEGASPSIATPDLSGVTGFLAPAASGATVEWIALITQGNAFSTSPPSGTDPFVENSGTYTEP